MPNKISYLIIAVFLSFSVSGLAQVTDSTKTEIKKEKTSGVFSMFQGNPGKAGLYSLILPGAGQFYNKKYWKIPLFVGAEVGSIALLIYNIDAYDFWDKGYKDLANGNISDFQGITNLASVKSIRDNKRQSKDISWVAVIAVHFITAADAFVDRHLIEFDVEDDIEIGLNLTAPYPGLSVVVEF